MTSRPSAQQCARHVKRALRCRSLIRLKLLTGFRAEQAGMSLRNFARLYAAHLRELARAAATSRTVSAA
jgi:hypothetical protein